MEGLLSRVVVFTTAVETSDPLTDVPSVRLYSSAYTVFVAFARLDTCIMIHEFVRDVVLVAEFLACVSRFSSPLKVLGIFAVMSPLLTLEYVVDAVVISPLVMAVPEVVLYNLAYPVPAEVFIVAS